MHPGLSSFAPVHAVAPQVTADGQEHGPLKGYALLLNASTTWPMSAASTSRLSSTKFGRLFVTALGGAVAAFLNALTTWLMSKASGCTEVAGGLNAETRSAARRVYMVTAAETFVQAPSLPLHDAP